MLTNVRRGHRGGDDGVTYYAAVFSKGTDLGGEAWSPLPGSLAFELAEVANQLAAYGCAGPEAREREKARVLTLASRLKRRLEGANRAQH